MIRHVIEKASRREKNAIDYILRDSMMIMVGGIDGRFRRERE